MTEFNLICDLFRERFRMNPEPDGSFLLVEEKEANGQKPHVVKSHKIKPVKEMAVFRFSLDDEDFLPFFKDSRTPECGPRFLKKFCDYVMLAHDEHELHILLLELKRSKKDPEIVQQLKASELFMRYVVDTAERIGHDNGCDGFNVRNVTFQKVCIKNDPAGHKLTVRPSVKFQKKNDGEVVTLHLSRNFNPNWTFR